MKRLPVVILLLMAMTATAWAADAAGPILPVPGLDALNEQAQGYDLTLEAGLDGGLSALAQRATAMVDELLRGGLRTCVRLLVVVVLCTMARSMGPGTGDGSLDVTGMAGVLVVTALSVGEMGSMIGLGRATIQEMDELAGLLLPVMATLTAATGRATAAAAHQGATVLFSDLLITLIDRLLMPMIYAYLAACCAYAALGNEGLKRIAGLIKTLVTGALSAMLLSYVAYLTVTGAVAGNADAAMVKAAKMAMSRAIPVVGGILSDAAESVLAGAGVLKGAVGVVGMLVVLGICLAPFLRLATHYLTYKVTAALAGTVADSRLTTLIDNISSAFGLVLGMTGSCALILLVSVVAAVSAVLA